MTQATIESSIISRAPELTEALGRALGELAQPGLYIALCGELGGGKTTFVRGLAASLGVTQPVASPTFVIMREYRGRITLFHTDFYRLEQESDLTLLELDDCLARGAVAAEWADKFTPPAGAPTLILDFGWAGETSRHIRIRNGNHAAAPLAEQLIAAAKSLVF